jgi:hypothetical protein
VITVFWVVIPCSLVDKLILKGSDDGVLHMKESCLRTLSIFQCFLRNTTFRKLDLFLSSGKTKCGLPSFHLKTETDPVAETLCF